MVPTPLRRKQKSTFGLLLALLALLALPAGQARASTDQIAMLMDDPGLYTNAGGTLSQLHALGVQMVRLSVRWQAIAPRANSHRRPHFNAADPGAYPAASWRAVDAIVQTAQQEGIRVDLDAMGGAPLWATGPRPPGGKKHFYQWKPSASQFRLFVQALGTRYSGSYTPAGASKPLPRVSFWSVWNEPDYGPSLAPQGVYPKHIRVENSPHLYRNLVDAAWNGLHRSGHGGDTFLFGEVAPRGAKTWGVFSGMKPLIFLRAMYCLNSHYRPLRGSAASLRGCPTSAAGSRRFRSQHPALFGASGFSDHPYMRWYPPNHEKHSDRNYSSLGTIGFLESALDRVARAYGSHTSFPIYDTEFGYITSPPNKRVKYPYVSPATAAYYINWAEYLHWRDPRLKSYNQYLLRDALQRTALHGYGFNSGLVFFNGTPKPMFDAYRLPLYLPQTNASRGSNLEVWGSARPAHFASADSGGAPQSVQIQFAASGSSTFSTVVNVPISDPGGYFDTHVQFPSSGTVRLLYTYPSGQAVESRHVDITLH